MSIVVENQNMINWTLTTIDKRAKLVPFHTHDLPTVEQLLADPMIYSFRTYLDRPALK